MKRKLFSVTKGILFSVLLALVVLVVPLETEAASSGNCGSNLKWSVSGTKLTITGKGEMNWGSSSIAPWDEYDDTIQSISIGSNVTSIANYAFDNFSKLQSVDIPNKVKMIGYNAFYKCGNLKSVKIGTGVKEIDSNAFAYCSNLTSLIFKGTSKIELIDYNAFYGCSNLMKIELPNSLIELGSQAFSNCTNLRTVKLGNKLTKIGGSAFRECSDLTAITIPDSVTVIEYYAFYNCDSLAEVNISEKSKLTSIETNVFYSCGALGEIYIPAQVTEISGYAFQYSGISTLKFATGSKIEKIGSWAFAGCDNLTSVTIPKSITSIDQNCFYECENLSTLKFATGSKLKTIGSQAFKSCAITKLDIPKSVITIGSAAFSSNKKLQSVTLKEGLVTIKDNAFNSCESLKEIVIPDTVTSLGGSTFERCTSLSSAVTGSNVNIIESNTFMNCSNLTYVKMGKNVTNIEKNAFNRCNLKSVTIPNSVTEVRSGSFSYNTELETLRLGNSIKKYGDYVFKGCEALKEIYIFAPSSTCNDSIFDEVENATIYGYSGTSAETIANKCGLSFVELQKKELTSDMLYLEQTSYEWDGMEKMPLVFAANDALEEGYDFTVLYDYDADAGKHYVEVYGDNEYDSYLQLEYVIEKGDLNDCTFTVKDFVYTAKAAKPTVTVTYKGKKLGTANYTVTCTASKVGKAKVTIKGKKNMTGSVTKSFNIIPKKVTNLKLSSTSAGKMKVTWTKSNSANCARYEIQYWKKGASSNKKLVKVFGYKNTAKTIGGLSKGTSYVVRIRQYKNDQYSNWTGTKTIKVKK